MHLLQFLAGRVFQGFPRRIFVGKKTVLFTNPAGSDALLLGIP